MSIRNKKSFSENQRKIIHVDMDSFYASVEIRDKPHLRELPVAVAGSSESRGVITTCNYVARKFGIRSAMASVTAKKLCPNLVFLPVNMDKYRYVSNEIHDIFKCYTRKIEPISLDEAYLDVSDSDYCNNNPVMMALQIRRKIFDDLKITASAGIATNKFLAKLASEWNKPNGQFVIYDEDIEDFIYKLPVRKINGVGEKTEKKLLEIGVKYFSDLQEIKIDKLIKVFGKYGENLYELCRGKDDRPVESNRISKSLSVEDTYFDDINSVEESVAELKKIHKKLLLRLNTKKGDRFSIKSCFVKIKFNDFKTISNQKSSMTFEYDIFENLLIKILSENKKPIRLIGAGVQFSNNSQLKLNIF